jgi:hypothetical protein
MTNRWLTALPWILAVVGVTIPLVGSGFAVWPLTLVWLLLIGVAWTLARPVLSERRSQRIAIAIALLPVLFLLAFEGGWWLIPAVLAWIVVELVEQRPTPHGPS